MKQVANLPPRKRNDLFAVAATKMGIRPAAVEKDFWIVWVLRQLFSLPDWSKRLRFKGGTSLSKAYDLIERFSEDIDLILDWTGLSEENPLATRSKTKQNRLNVSINEAAQKVIAKTFLPDIRQSVSSLCEAALDDADPHVINITYPAEFAAGYLRPVVKLEIGPLAAMLPMQKCAIQSYAAEHTPMAFEEPSVDVPTICAERTFWEKLTILHAEAHRPGDKPFPPRYARHYYDVCRMANSRCADRALANTALLNEVVAFKRKFYPANWANYETATCDGLQLLPTPQHGPALKKDYAEMAEMVFGNRPDFDTVLRTIEGLQSRIHRSNLT